MAGPVKKTSSTIKDALTRKLGPAPAWVWLGLFAVAVYWYRARHGSAGGTATTTSGSVDLGTLADLGYQATPIGGGGTGGGGDSGSSSSGGSSSAGGNGKFLAARLKNLLARIRKLEKENAKLRKQVGNKPNKRPKRRKPAARAQAPLKAQVVQRPPQIAAPLQTAVAHPRAVAPAAQKPRTPVGKRPAQKGRR